MRADRILAGTASDGDISARLAMNLRISSAVQWKQRITARRSRNQTQLQRLKPTEGNFGSDGLKPSPPNRIKVLRVA